MSADSHRLPAAFLLLAPLLTACSSSSNPSASPGDRDATSDAADASTATGDGEAGASMDASQGDSEGNGDAAQPSDSSADGDAATAADLCRTYGLQVAGPGDTCDAGLALTCSAGECHFGGMCSLAGYPCECCGPSSIFGHDGGDASSE